MVNDPGFMEDVKSWCKTTGNILVSLDKEGKTITAVIKKNNVRIVVCSMSLDVMGLKMEELIDGVEETGVISYLDAANQSVVNLFI